MISILKRMSLLNGLVCVAAVASSVSVWAADPRPPVNFRSVNPVLQTLVDAVLAADDTVDFVYPRFDEKFCSVKEERLKYDVQGSMKNTPWLDGERADINGWTTYAVDRAADHTGIAFASKAMIRTDALALIRYAAYIGQKKSYPNETPEFSPRFNAILKRLAVAVRLSEVKDLLEAGRLLAKDMIAREIDRTQEMIKCLEALTCVYPGEDVAASVAWRKRYLADQIATLPTYDEVQINLNQESGQPVQLTVSSPNMGRFIFAREIERQTFFIVPGSGKIVFGERSASAEAQAFHKVPVEDLNRFHETLEETLVGVQQGDGKSKQKAQDAYRQALVEFKRAIRGEF